MVSFNTDIPFKGLRISGVGICKSTLRVIFLQRSLVKIKILKFGEPAKNNTTYQNHRKAKFAPTGRTISPEPEKPVQKAGLFRIGKPRLP
jgi:hypothetical protein